MVPEATSLRCRRCRAHFTTPELARLGAERGGGPTFGAPGGVGLAEEPAEFLTEGFFSGFDDPLEAARPRGPGDSNYELTFSLHDLGGDTSGDWDATMPSIEPEVPSSDEIEAIAPTPAASRERDSWHVRFVESWGLALIGAAVGLIALAIPVIAYLLWRALAGGTTVGGPLATVIGGFACAVALLMISIPLILLATCFTELARDVRRLREYLERRARLGGR
jgi:hypothetical protein